jgi:hypothetical protein
MKQVLMGHLKAMQQHYLRLGIDPAKGRENDEKLGVFFDVADACWKAKEVSRSILEKHVEGLQKLDPRITFEQVSILVTTTTDHKETPNVRLETQRLLKDPGDQDDGDVVVTKHTSNRSNEQPLHVGETRGLHVTTEVDVKKGNREEEEQKVNACISPLLKGSSLKGSSLKGASSKDSFLDVNGSAESIGDRVRKKKGLGLGGGDTGSQGKKNEQKGGDTGSRGKKNEKGTSEGSSKTNSLNKVETPARLQKKKDFDQGCIAEFDNGERKFVQIQGVTEETAQKVLM